MMLECTANKSTTYKSTLMPVFLIPFLVLAARNTKAHKAQAEAAIMDAQTRSAQYELELGDYGTGTWVVTSMDPITGSPVSCVLVQRE
jgi:hypothetical protein